MENKNKLTPMFFLSLLLFPIFVIINKCKPTFVGNKTKTTFIANDSINVHTLK